VVLNQRARVAPIDVGEAKTLSRNGKQPTLGMWYWHPVTFGRQTPLGDRSEVRKR
jgi:hypothetical protein